VTNEHLSSPQANPARHEPSSARPATCTCCGGAREPDPTDDYMRMLRRLAEIGMARAEQLHLQMRDETNTRRAEPAAAPDADAPDLAKTDQPKPKLPNPDLALHRTTRVVSLCMSLSLRFHKERLEREKQTAADHAVVEKQRKARRKQQIERVVKEAIEREADQRVNEDGSEDASFDVVELETELSEPLDEDDIVRDLDRCSLGELIGRICRELGFKPDWEFWQQHQWALEEAGLKPPGSPYAEPPPPEPPPPEPERPEPAEAEAEEPEPPEIEPEEPPPETPAEPPKRNIDYYRTPEHQRELEEYRARVIARLHGRL
jgi:hypothetical protein